jgi:hypothetical protein
VGAYQHNSLSFAQFVSSSDAYLRLKAVVNVESSFSRLKLDLWKKDCSCVVSGNALKEPIAAANDNSSDLSFSSDSLSIMRVSTCGDAGVSNL